MIKNLVILGDDKIAGAVSKQISEAENCIVYIDRSRNIPRILKLIKRKVLSPVLMAKMVISEILRSGRRPEESLPSIRNNQDLLQAITKNQPERIILFRAGLIININIIESGVPILNIHAATIPDYGGIGSIERAIRDRAYSQYASMHKVTVSIDEGEVIDKIRYQLNPKLSYFQNEFSAYLAAQELLLKTLSI